MLENTNTLDLVRVAETTSQHLQLMYSGPTDLKNGLRFPFYSNRPLSGYSNKQRISEQETRFAFLTKLYDEIQVKDLPVHYHIETPTALAYSDFSTNGVKLKSK